MATASAHTNELSRKLKNLEEKVRKGLVGDGMQNVSAASNVFHSKQTKK